MEDGGGTGRGGGGKVDCGLLIFTTQVQKKCFSNKFFGRIIRVFLFFLLLYSILENGCGSSTTFYKKKNFQQQQKKNENSENRGEGEGGKEQRIV